MATIASLQPQNIVLLLEDGTEFWGYSFGKRKKAFGEVVFNTAMCGYQEVLTDPSYWQQIVVMTHPHQGNYGVNENDVESYGGLKVAGFVVQEYTQEPTNHAAQSSLPKYLDENNIPGLWGVDTRALTVHIRNAGCMRGLLLSDQERKALGNNFNEIFSSYPSFIGRDLTHEVTTKNPYWFSEKGNHLVCVLDFGVKLNLLRSLENHGAKVLVLPSKTTAKEILSYKPNGVFLSNGPGDPAATTYAVETVKNLIGKIPILGVCLGHQILALALGGKTYKMKFGHRGVNQPVLNLIAKTVEISSHNHGFAVETASLPPFVKTTHLNLNDGVCEGLEYEQAQAFSVQYHPEAAPGPHDSNYLFEKFFKCMM